MKELLFDVLFMSDIRKDLLLLLNEGPRDLDTIMDIMHIEKQPLALQIKILEDQYLVKKQTGSPGSYALTTIGDLLVKEMKPLMGILDFLDSNNGYWEDHRLDFIPHGLLERIEELGPFTISEPRLSEIYEFDNTLQENPGFLIHCIWSLHTFIPCLYLYFWNFLIRVLTYQWFSAGDCLQRYSPNNTISLKD